MKPLIVLQTDFGMSWPFVSTMKGVIKGIDPELEIIDSSHHIEQFNVLEASQQLDYIIPFYKSGTVIVSVVDPGVGSARVACMAKLKNGIYVITPDNGTLTHLYHKVGVESVRVIEHRLQGTEDVTVFHGRDIFAYTAALFASNTIEYEQVGKEYPVEDIVLLDDEYLQATVTSSTIKGIVSNVADPFGSIVFNIKTSDFMNYYKMGEYVHITLKCDNEVYFDEDVLYSDSFASVPYKHPVLFHSSSNYISIGLNQGSFKAKYDVRSGMNYTIETHAL